MWLAVSSSCFRASPLSIFKGSIHKVSQAPEDVWDHGCEDTIHPTQESTPLLRQLNLADGYVIRRGCWSHFGSGFSLHYPEFTPPGLSLCWCAIRQRCYLSVRTILYLYIYVCLGGRKEFVFNRALMRKTFFVKSCSSLVTI